MLAAVSSLAATLEAEIAWFEALLDSRLKSQTGETEPTADAPPAPAFPDHDPYADLCRNAGLGEDERLVLILSLLPSLRPQALDPLSIRNATTDRTFTEFGGITAGRGFRPTRETALFLLAGHDMARRLAAMAMFADGASLVRHQLIARGDDPFAPWLPLDPHPDLLARMIAMATSG